MKVNFHKLNSIGNEQLKYAVIAARHNGKWIFVKHKERETWEIAGGHREEDENILDTASRELSEETGALYFTTMPICIYSVITTETETFGKLFLSEVETLETLPNFEIGELLLSDTLPENLTYPLIQPLLFKKAEEFYLNKSQL